jgi:hypothetical protein
MNNRWKTYKVCHCFAYHFPHRLADKLCRYRKDGTLRMPEDEDFYDPTKDNPDEPRYYGGD